MSEELIEVVRFLSAEGYIIRTPQGFYIFTNKFYDTFTGKDVGIVPEGLPVIAKSETVHVAVPLNKDLPPTQWYKQFILDCGIPRRAVNPRGDSYDINQYSAKADKAFSKIMIRSNIIYDLLVKSTQLYYKSSVSYKLKIGNYIIDGAWETHYQALVDSLVEGKVEQHIKQELQDDNSGSSRYKLEQRTGEGAPKGLQQKGQGWPERKKPGT